MWAIASKCLRPFPIGSDIGAGPIQSKEYFGSHMAAFVAALVKRGQTFIQLAKAALTKGGYKSSLPSSGLINALIGQSHILVTRPL